MADVLILGASGRFGSNCEKVFRERGYTLKRFHRGHDDLDKSVEQAKIVINGWNPPYDKWHDDVPKFTAGLIGSLKNSDATVIIPGNVYVFGISSPSPWGPSSPHAAKNPLGKIRIDMEQAYKSAGVRTLILRTGDFLDTAASGNWFDKVMVKNIRRGKFVYPGDPTALHAWAYLPDVARAIADLAAKSDLLSTFTDITFRGYTLTGNDIAEYLCQICERKVQVSKFPWWQVKLAQPFLPFASKLLEMRYLWDHPHELDNRAFQAMLPEFRDTDPQLAIAAATRPML